MSANKRDTLYDELLCRLICGKYRFGDRIIVNYLAAETGASRQPIGAALNALAVEGYVRVVPQVGCDVVHPSPGRIDDFFRCLVLVEEEFAGLAAARGGPSSSPCAHSPVNGTALRIAKSSCEARNSSTLFTRWLDRRS